MLGVWGLATTASIAGAISMLYPNLKGQFGTPIKVGKKSEFPAALPGDFKKSVREFPSFKGIGMGAPLPAGRRYHLEEACKYGTDVLSCW
jgi:hypothetical protein